MDRREHRVHLRFHADDTDITIEQLGREHQPCSQPSASDRNEDVKLRSEFIGQLEHQ